jgi:hypothetical protein
VVIRDSEALVSHHQLLKIQLSLGRWTTTRPELRGDENYINQKKMNNIKFERNNVLKSPTALCRDVLQCGDYVSIFGVNWSL